MEYEAEALGAWCGTRVRGVFSDDNHFSVSANGNMTINLGPGLAWLKMDEFWGVNIFEKNTTLLSIDTADGALTRYAAICLQLNKNLNEGKAIVKYGPYGTNPDLNSLPLPIQNSLDYDEIYVAAIRVRAGATEILMSDITDLRLNEAYCGLMSDGVTGIPTQALDDAWQCWFSNLKIGAEQKAEAFIAWINSVKTDNIVTIADIQEHVNHIVAVSDNQPDNQPEGSLWLDTSDGLSLINENGIMIGNAVISETEPHSNPDFWLHTQGN